jgi:hypothetical protein
MADVYIPNPVATGPILQNLIETTYAANNVPNTASDSQLLGINLVFNNSVNPTFNASPPINRS